MDITLYLPDDLGQWAKAQDGLNLSKLFRAAVIDLRERTEATERTLAESDVHELDALDDDGVSYTARLHGAVIGGDPEDLVSTAYLLDDGRVVVFDGERLVFLRDPDEMREWLDPGEFVKAMAAVGRRAVIDVGKRD